jgi:hypothetical protein
MGSRIYVSFWITNRAWEFSFYRRYCKSADFNNNNLRYLLTTGNGLKTWNDSIFADKVYHDARRALRASSYYGVDSTLPGLRYTNKQFYPGKCSLTDQIMYSFASSWQRFPGVKTSKKFGDFWALGGIRRLFGEF